MFSSVCSILVAGDEAAMFGVPRANQGAESAIWTTFWAKRRVRESLGSRRRGRQGHAAMRPCVPVAFAAVGLLMEKGFDVAGSRFEIGALDVEKGGRRCRRHFGPTPYFVFRFNFCCTSSRDLTALKYRR